MQNLLQIIYSIWMVWERFNLKNQIVELNSQCGSKTCVQDVLDSTELAGSFRNLVQK